MTVSAPPRPPLAPSPDELEALIKEARRRAWRRRLAYVLSLFVVGGALGLYFAVGPGGGTPGSDGSTGHPRPSGQAQEGQRIARVAARTIIVEAGLPSPGLWWAMNGLGLWWSRDGGKRWRTIAPPQVSSSGDVVARVSDISAVDDQHIWVGAADIAGDRVVNGSTRHMAIERMQDGGKTWKSVVPPGCYGCGGAYLSFLDVRRGFALVGMQPEPQLYLTRDGGDSWQRIGSDVSFTGPIRFLSDRVGWAVSEPGRMIGPSQSVPLGGGLLYRTIDGGRHWRRVVLTPPPRYRGSPATAGVPRFFSARWGVVGVRYRDRTRAQHLLIYTTHDGGDSWSAHPAPVAVDLRAYSWGIPEGLPFRLRR
ncbi:MAG: hypothetical protein H0W90_08775 [Actinobacteria bacterium]|nr:hypothetical protein [Actinomycetota bacterium]